MEGLWRSGPKMNLYFKGVGFVVLLTGGVEVGIDIYRLLWFVEAGCAAFRAAVANRNRKVWAPV